MQVRKRLILSKYIGFMSIFNLCYIYTYTYIYIYTYTYTQIYIYIHILATSTLGAKIFC